MARRRKNKKVSTYGTSNSTSSSMGTRATKGEKVESPKSNGSDVPESVKEHAEAVQSLNKTSEAVGSKMSSGARSANNDPEWYTKDSQMVIDVASIPFSEPLGAIVPNLVSGQSFMGASDDVTKSGLKANTSPNTHTIPGVLTCRTKSSFGYSRDIRDPINVCATALYSHVRAVNSGRKNYDAPDLFIYCASLADVYSFVTWAIRIYAKAFLASSRNLYVGKGLLESERIDANSVLNNLANFRYWINAYIAKISAYAVPSDIAYFQRRAWMYAHVYLENPDSNIKDQLYQFTPDGFYRFELDSSGAGCLIYETLPNIIGHGNTMSITDIEAIGDWLMANITNDEDFGLMSGDIVKAYNGNIIGLPSIPEQVELLPVYSEYVLLQIKNATVLQAQRGNTNALIYDTMSSGVELKTGNVYQSINGILQSVEGYNYQFGSGGTTWTPIAAGMRHTLTVHTPTPSPVDVMEITRLTVCSKMVIDNSGSGNNNVPVVAFSTGADIVVDAYVTIYDQNGAIDVTSAIECSLYTKNSWVTTAWSVLTKLIKFKYSPLLYALEFSGGTGVAADPAIISDVELLNEIDNYTIIDGDQLSRIHEVAMLSMFWVPGIARLVNF